MGCGAETEANALITSLTGDVNYEIPNVNIEGIKFQIPVGTGDQIFAKVPAITLTQLTTGTVGGTGVFDRIMQAMSAHLQKEFDANRISGAEYTKAYVAMVDTALAQSVQFLLTKDEAFWRSQNAQVAAITGMIAAETARMQFVTMKFQANESKANYAIAKMRLADISMQYCINKYNLEYILPTQKELTEEQLEVQRAQTLDTRTDGTAITGVVGKQKTLLDKQAITAQEQAEAQRAQTMDTRLDGTTPVVGVLGKQKSLLTQQVESYKRNSENQTAKMFTDAWITMKTIDEGLLPPTNFQNTSLDSILTKLKLNNGL